MFNLLSICLTIFLETFIRNPKEPSASARFSTDLILEFKMSWRQYLKMKDTHEILIGFLRGGGDSPNLP